MTLKQKKEILAALCGYLPYGVKVQYRGNDFLLNNTHSDGRIHIGSRESYKGDWYCGFDDKEYPVPYLRPMASITAKESEELRHISRTVEIEGVGEWARFSSVNPEFVTYLESHLLDFRGLIPQGLALPAPEGMYEKLEETA